MNGQLVSEWMNQCKRDGKGRDRRTKATETCIGPGKEELPETESAWWEGLAGLG